MEDKIRKLEEAYAAGLDNDERLRKEFAKAFGWFEDREIMYARYDNTDQKPTCPTWEQIFIELGRLLAGKTATRLENQVNDLQERIFNLENPRKG